jgi:DNA replication protein DnaC
VKGDEHPTTRTFARALPPLRLYQVEQELPARLEQAAKQELSYADFLDQLLAGEIDSKTYQHHQMRIAMARFPFQKTLESFDSVQRRIM